MWPWKKQQAPVIGPGVRIQGRVESDGDLELAGEVHGDMLVAGALTLRSTARLYGDIRCASLQIEQGAVFSGTNRMGGGLPALPAPALTQTYAPAETTPEPVPVPLQVLLEPVGIAEKELLGVIPRTESPAFYGGFSPAIKST